MRVSSTTLTFFVSFLVVGSGALIFLWLNADKISVPQPDTQPTLPPPATVVRVPERILPQPDAPAPPTAVSGPTPAPSTPALPAMRPADIVQSLMGLFKGNPDTAMQTLAKSGTITTELADKIQGILSKGGTSIKSIREIGVQNNGKEIVYSVELEDGTKGELVLKKDDSGKWSIKALSIPGMEDADTVKQSILESPLRTSYDFIEAVSKQDFKRAKSMAYESSLKDVTIAGLCIIFEEASYSLRDQAPVKVQFESESNAGALVYLQAKDGTSLGNIGLTLVKEGDAWKVSEAALDNMLQGYIKSMGGADEIFIPIVKNPKGGDSLALFFGFNEASLTPRSMRQLKIVAEVLKAATTTKLEISGHTDDLGSDSYNIALSNRRAQAVKDALISFGIPEATILTHGYGKSQPRRTYSGADPDSPMDDARKENRRAEMYLDF